MAAPVHSDGTDWRLAFRTNMGFRGPVDACTFARLGRPLLTDAPLQSTRARGSALVVIPVRTVELTGEHAAFPETTSRSGTDRGRCDPASRINSLSPCTMRCPLFTHCSDGNPRRRLLRGSKALVQLVVLDLHDTSPTGSLDRRRDSILAYRAHCMAFRQRQPNFHLQTSGDRTHERHRNHATRSPFVGFMRKIFG